MPLGGVQAELGEVVLEVVAETVQLVAPDVRRILENGDVTGMRGQRRFDLRRPSRSSGEVVERDRGGHRGLSRGTVLGRASLGVGSPRLGRGTLADTVTWCHGHRAREPAIPAFHHVLINVLRDLAEALRQRGQVRPKDGDEGSRIRLRCHAVHHERPQLLVRVLA